VLVPKEKLAIEIAKVDSVEIDDVDLAEAGQHKVLEEFASDPASSNHKYTRLLVER